MSEGVGLADVLEGGEVNILHLPPTNDVVQSG